ncbi:molybdenum cofactor biosynthesis protein MoaE [Desulfobacterales bacterium HSG17]|nr:molybdenum cofactor biosynthesis protein MoaE [Desulfobacterales bacterium HSG17]
MDNAIDIQKMIQTIKERPDYHKAGMILAHNGVVRETSRDGRMVTELTVSVDHEKLAGVIAAGKQRSGIIEVLIEINEGRPLCVGDDVMGLVVAGDIRENVIRTLEETLDAVKSTVTSKTEKFRDG